MLTANGQRATRALSTAFWVGGDAVADDLRDCAINAWRPEDMRSALDARDRKRCGALAPACGLYLIRVDY